MLPMIRILSRWFAPTRDALFNPSIPWDWRLRLIGLQVMLLIAYPMCYLPYLFSRRYKAITITTRGQHTLRAIIFQPRKRQVYQSAPLHLHLHSGAFVGGIAEAQADWCSLLSDKTGAVIVSAEYRLAPRYRYPCAHEDVEDIVKWLISNAKKLWNADPDTLTVSGHSAGASLMFVAGSRARAAVGFYAPVDFRLPPWEKPRSGNFPKNDPLAFLLPLYDAYASPVRYRTLNDPILNPILKPLSETPENVLFIVPLIDILVKEQFNFIERLRNELQYSGEDTNRRFETVIFEKGFHGWLELPRSVIDEEERTKAYNEAIEFISATHRRNR